MDDIEAMNFGHISDSVWRKYAVYGSSNIIIGDEEKEAKLKIYKKDRILMDEMLRTLKTYEKLDYFKLYAVRHHGVKLITVNLMRTRKK